MRISIELANSPEFYTNLDTISGTITLYPDGVEQFNAIIVKLEGESKTALGAPNVIHEDYPQPTARRRSSAPGAHHAQVIYENHKILYKVQQIRPDETVPPSSGRVTLDRRPLKYPFNFRLPFNNACSDPDAMAKIGGFNGAGGFSGPSLFGVGGIRLMDGSRQLLYKHVTKTLPPSFTGFPRQAEIRYYIKVTIQRPGLLSSNWRHQLGFKFMPIEPPRPQPTNQEAYARRPFTFRPQTPGLGTLAPSKTSKRNSMFARKPSPAKLDISGALRSDEEQPPSIEISARLPHPPILTCNKPVPLRLLAKKLAESNGECYLVSIQIDLVGSTVVRCQDLINTEPSRWVIISRSGLAIPLQKGSDDAVGSETEVISALWNKPLPNTVMPSFVTCNLKRSYSLELKLGVSWGKPPGATTAIPDEVSSLSSKTSGLSLKKIKGKDKASTPVQTIYLPLHFSAVQVYSGLTPPESLAQAALKARKQQTQLQGQRPSTRPNGSSSQSAPSLPPRQQQQQHNPLYPPQLRPGQVAGQAVPAGNSANGYGGAAPASDVAAAPPYDDAPPSYDDAMAEHLSGPAVPEQSRPAYSGVTNENSPDSLPAPAKS